MCLSGVCFSGLVLRIKAATKPLVIRHKHREKLLCKTVPDDITSIMFQLQQRHKQKHALPFGCSSRGDTAAFRGSKQHGSKPDQNSRKVWSDSTFCSCDPSLTLLLLNINLPPLYRASGEIEYKTEDSVCKLKA